MKPRATIPAAIAAMVIAWQPLVPTTTRAAALEDALARLTTKLAEEIRPGATPAPDNHQRQLAMLLARLQSSVDRQLWRDALAHLSHFDSALKPESAVEIIQLIHEVRMEVQDRMSQSHTAEISRLTRAMEDALEVAGRATKVTDLDSVIRELTALQGEKTYQPVHLRGSYEQLKRAIMAVARLQDALLLEASGHAAQAAATLDDLLKNESSQFLGRSDLIARADRLREKAAQTLAAADDEFGIRVTSLEDLDEAATALTRQLSARPEDKRLRDYAHQLTLLRRARDELRAARYGTATDVALSVGFGEMPIAADLLELQQQILVAVLPHYLQAEAPVTRQPGEPVHDVLLRLLHEATEKQNWRAALRALEALQLFSYRHSTAPPWLGCDLRGFAAITIAAEQEKAGFGDEAANRYREALTCAGEHLPVAWVTERVKTLDLQHAGKQTPPAKRSKPR